MSTKPVSSKPTETRFIVSNIFGYNSRQPLVRIVYKTSNLDVMIPPEDARAFALNLLQCAEAAEQDAFFVWFLENQVNAEPPAVAGMLQEFRQWRDQRREAGQA